MTVFYTEIYTQCFFYFQDAIQKVETIEYLNEKEDTYCCQSRTAETTNKNLEHVIENVFIWLGESKNLYLFFKVRAALKIIIFFLECALYPWTVLCAGFVLVCCLTYGVIYVDLVTDPVELWASSTSQCRKERQYFNENFGPFYRVQQVIVTSNGLDNVNIGNLFLLFIFFSNFCENY